MPDFHIRDALLSDGWSREVRIEVREGRIRHILAQTPPQPDDIRLDTVVPGLGNLHSHAFQRGMAGLAEQRGPGQDSFWSWRETMYHFVAHMTPDHLRAIAALAYCDMLEAGFTSVGEFHYVHHPADGSAYTDPAVMSAALCEAARETGIALTLLPVFYRYADFNQTPATSRQRPFLNTPDSFLHLVEAAASHVAALPHAQLGWAPHSLRAASLADIRVLAPVLDGPVHIHVAEQRREVEACLTAHGARPVAYLMDEIAIDRSWCLIHATHLDDDELTRLALSGAVAGLCPITEANLGDGLFPADRFLALGGRIGLGSDSHVRIDLAEEVRTLEYGLRLTHEARNLLGKPEKSTGRRIFDACVNGAAQALNQPSQGLQTGERADFVCLDTDHPSLAGRSGDTALDSWLFSGDGRLVKAVYLAGHQVVSQGRALCRDAVNRRYGETLSALLKTVS